MSDIFYSVKKEGRGNRFSYYCSKEEYELYIKEQKDSRKKKEVLFTEKELNRLKKEQETKKYKDLMDFVMDEIYHYEKGMVFPSSLIVRIKKLKDFYDYDIIKDAFAASYDSIMWALSNKNFTNEYNKTSYIMAIVESKINDVYLEAKRKESQSEKALQVDQAIDLNLFNDSVDVNVSFKNSKMKDISAFLDD